MKVVVFLAPPLVADPVAECLHFLGSCVKFVALVSYAVFATLGGPPKEANNLFTTTALMMATMTKSRNAAGIPSSYDSRPTTHSSLIQQQVLDLETN